MSTLKEQLVNQQERIYRTMRGAGATSIVCGIVAASVGVTTGVLMIISGAKLLARKSDVII